MRYLSWLLCQLALSCSSAGADFSMFSSEAALLQLCSAGVPDLAFLPLTAALLAQA